jgi:hypothetical protein
MKRVGATVATALWLGLGANLAYATGVTYAYNCTPSLDHQREFFIWDKFGVTNATPDRTLWVLCTVPREPGDNNATFGATVVLFNRGAINQTTTCYLREGVLPGVFLKTFVRNTIMAGGDFGLMSFDAFFVSSPIASSVHLVCALPPLTGVGTIAEFG